MFSVRYMLKVSIYFRLISVFEGLKVGLLLIYASEINIIVKLIIYESTYIYIYIYISTFGVPKYLEWSFLVCRVLDL